MLTKFDNSKILTSLSISLILEYITRIYFHLKQSEVEIYETKINLK